RPRSSTSCARPGARCRSAAGRRRSRSTCRPTGGACWTARSRADAGAAERLHSASLGGIDGADMTIVVTTRRLPRAVEDELARRYTVRKLDAEFTPPRADIIEACQGADVLLKTAGDPMPADMVAELPDSIRMV